MSKIPAVLDHCLVRYLERAKGMDLDVVRAEIAALVQSAVNLGAVTYAIDGMTFILDGPKVVTIIPVKSGASSRKESARRNGRSQRVQR